MHPEEAAFQAALDKDPADKNARLAFADWLRDRDDPRAAGHQWMAESGMRMWSFAMGSTAGVHDHWCWGKITGTTKQNKKTFARSLLRDALFLAVRKRSVNEGRSEWWTFFPSRREAEDALALAYLEVYGARQA